MQSPYCSAGRPARNLQTQPDRTEHSKSGPVKDQTNKQTQKISKLHHMKTCLCWNEFFSRASFLYSYTSMKVWTSQRARKETRCVTSQLLRNIPIFVRLFSSLLPLFPSSFLLFSFVLAFFPFISLFRILHSTFPFSRCFFLFQPLVPLFLLLPHPILKKKKKKNSARTAEWTTSTQPNKKKKGGGDQHKSWQY